VLQQQRVRLRVLGRRREAAVRGVIAEHQLEHGALESALARGQVRVEAGVEHVARGGASDGGGVHHEVHKDLLPARRIGLHVGWHGGGGGGGLAWHGGLWRVHADKIDPKVRLCVRQQRRLGR